MADAGETSATTPVCSQCGEFTLLPAQRRVAGLATCASELCAHEALASVKHRTAYMGTAVAEAAHAVSVTSPSGLTLRCVQCQVLPVTRVVSNVGYCSSACQDQHLTERSAYGTDSALFVGGMIERRLNGGYEAHEIASQLLAMNRAAESIATLQQAGVMGASGISVADVEAALQSMMTGADGLAYAIRTAITEAQKRTQFFPYEQVKDMMQRVHVWLERMRTRDDMRASTGGLQSVSLDEIKLDAHYQPVLLAHYIARMFQSWRALGGRLLVPSSVRRAYRMLYSQVGGARAYLLLNTVFSALTLEHGDAVHYDAMDIAHAGAANEQEQMLEAQVNATLRTVEGLIGVEAQDSDAHLIGATTLLSRAKALANRATKRITEYSSQQLIDTLGEQLRAMRFIAQRTNGTRALEAVRTYATLAWVAGLQGAVPDADAGKHMRAMFADLKARAERVRGNVLSAKDGVVIGDAASPQLRPVNHVQHGKNWAGLLMTYETAHMQTSAARLREQAAAAANNYDRDVTRVLTVLASKHGGAQVYTFLEAFVAQIETLAP